MVNPIRFDEIFRMLIELYPNRTVHLGIDLKSHLLYGVRRKLSYEISVWLGDDVVDGEVIHRAELKTFESQEEFVAYVDYLRTVKVGMN